MSSSQFSPVKRLQVPVDAGLVLAAKIAELALESRCIAAAVNVAHVPVDVGLVAASVLADGAAVDTGGYAHDDVVESLLRLLVRWHEDRSQWVVQVVVVWNRDEGVY